MSSRLECHIPVIKSIVRRGSGEIIARRPVLLAGLGMTSHFMETCGEMIAEEWGWPLGQVQVLL